MNAEQAKTISLFEILDKLGFKPVRKTKNDAYYNYPVEKKGRKANLHVNLKKNIWYDHRTKEGGKVIDFAVTYLRDNGKSHRISNALLFIETTIGYVKPNVSETAVSDEPYSISTIRDITDPALIDEIESKGISLKLAKKYLQEIKVYDRKQKSHFLTLGYKHDDEGYFLENKYCQHFIGNNPAVTFIRGQYTGPSYIHVFKDRWDYFSFLEHQKVLALKYDAIILNSYTCVPQCSGYFFKYGYRFVFTYMPNTADGENAKLELSEIFKRESNLIHRPMNSMYPPPHESVNAWWQERKQKLSHSQ